MTQPINTQPHEYAERVLLLVSGMSPQIVTETLFALSQQTPAYIPTRVRLVTTRFGAQKARTQLLAKPDGAFHRLCREYGIPANIFVDQDIEVITDADGHPLDDIQTRQENESAANKLVHVVREICRNDNSALHVSMAGGRKTMGYFAGYALSLFGRPQDKLSHVLVTSGFESLPDFFYPSHEKRHLLNRAGETLDSLTAHIECADIPFMLLRQLLAKQNLLASNDHFSDIINRYNSFNQGVKVHIDPKFEWIEINDGRLNLKPIDFAFFLTIMTYALRGKEYLVKPKTNARDQVLGCQIAVIYHQISHTEDLDAGVAKTLLAGVDKAWISQRLKMIHKQLAQLMGPETLERMKFSSKQQGRDHVMMISYKPTDIDWPNWGISALSAIDCVHYLHKVAKEFSIHEYQQLITAFKSQNIPNK
jgi:CRISPR-associated protein (TIGR02584 family)